MVAADCAGAVLPRPWRHHFHRHVAMHTICICIYMSAYLLHVQLSRGLMTNTSSPWCISPSWSWWRGWWPCCIFFILLVVSYSHYKYVFRNFVFPFSVVFLMSVFHVAAARIDPNPLTPPPHHHTTPPSRPEGRCWHTLTPVPPTVLTLTP